MTTPEIAPYKAFLIKENKCNAIPVSERFGTLEMCVKTNIDQSMRI